MSLGSLDGMSFDFNDHGWASNKRMQLADPTCHAPGCKATAMVRFGFRTLRDFGVC